MKDAHPERTRGARRSGRAPLPTEPNGDGHARPGESPMPAVNLTGSTGDGYVLGDGPQDGPSGHARDLQARTALMKEAARRAFDGAGERSEPALPGVAGLPLARQSAPTPAEAARSLLARRRLSLLAGLI